MRYLYYGLAGVLFLLALVPGVHHWAWGEERPGYSANAAAGRTPFTDYRGESPGTVCHITTADLPQPYATSSSENHPRLVPRPENAWPQGLAGFKVERYAEQLENHGMIRTAPNGDLFIAESGPGRILVFRGITSSGKPERMGTFATGLNRPFGIAFYPGGPNPKYVYVGNTDSVVRFPYENGDLKARRPQEVVIPNIPSGDERVGGGGHWTRDIAFTLDGKRMYVSVRSHTNVNDPDSDPSEYHRPDIFEANPDGTNIRVYAWGIHNPMGLAVDSETGELWTSVNERDALGDNPPPDYITHVQENGFYGWLWYYIGGNSDPRLMGKHPELKDKVIVADVLLGPHNASLELTFYEGQQFPPEFRGGIFAAEHGSWNRSVRTGYEIIVVPLRNGRASGEYENFLTGFVTMDGKVWGRPVGVAVAKDGALMVSDDGSNSIWRVNYAKK
jgi:glucose/arabinose dehydrogenase